MSNENEYLIYFVWGWGKYGRRISKHRSYLGKKLEESVLHTQILDSKIDSWPQPMVVIIADIEYIHYVFHIYLFNSHKLVRCTLFLSQFYEWDSWDTG